MMRLSNPFPLKYGDDPRLAFMRFCTHQDLTDLADILMTEKGSKRWTEQLSTNPRFIRNRKDLTRSWDVIAAEYSVRCRYDCIEGKRRKGVYCMKKFPAMFAKT
jgi:hypothetical protein